MNDELKQQIEAAEKAVEQAQERLGEAKRHLRALRVEHAKLVFGIDIGMVVNGSGARNPGEHVITAIDPRFHPKRPWVTGIRKKKSGEWGKQEINLFDDWEVAEPAVESRP